MFFLLKISCTGTGVPKSSFQTESSSFRRPQEGSFFTRSLSELFSGDLIPRLRGTRSETGRKGRKVNFYSCIISLL